VYGHSHGRLVPDGKQWDVGVDNNDYLPVSFEKLQEIMSNLQDNPNRLMPALKDISEELIAAVSNAILNEIKLIKKDYHYEQIHMCGDLQTDSRKLYELSRMNRNYNILMNAWQSFELFSYAPPLTPVAGNSVKGLLNFSGVDTPAGKALSRFLATCLANGYVPEKREMTKAMGAFYDIR